MAALSVDLLVFDEGVYLVYQKVVAKDDVEVVNSVLIWVAETEILTAVVTGH